jgi:hypothetical protein
MSGKIFINYRRGDDPGFTGRLFDRLEDAFAADQLFMDVDSIAPGLDFVRVLEEHVGNCDIFLAVIGPNWLDARDETGNRRLDNPSDFVRIEIESALKFGKRIIPVLVNNAPMPQARQLPESLEPLSRRNAVRLSHERFKADAQGLVKQLEKAVEDAEAALQRAEDEAARDAELADTVEAYQAFLKERPQSRHAARARNRLRALRAKANPPSGAFNAWMAGAFALLAPAILFAAYVIFQNEALQKPMDDLGLMLGGVDGSTKDSQFVGVIYVRLAIFTLGLAMMFRIGSGPGFAVSLFWLGCVAAVLGVLTVLPLLRFYPDLESGHTPEGNIGVGNVLVALLLIAGSGLALAKWRREVLSKLEVAIYWFGSGLALVYATSIYGFYGLPYDVAYLGYYQLRGDVSRLTNGLAAVVAIFPVLFLFKPARIPNWAEVGIYGIGITILASYALSELSIYVEQYWLGGLVAFLLGLLVAAAVIALSFVRVRQRQARS